MYTNEKMGNLCFRRKLLDVVMLLFGMLHTKILSSMTTSVRYYMMPLSPRNPPVFEDPAFF